MNCRICNAETTLLFVKKVLNKYDVKYFTCPFCDFIQTEEPYWLSEAYEKAIANTDVGYVNRNIIFSHITSSIIKCFFSSKRKYLDYGGGYGLFVRLMRDNGFDFYIEDKYCDNIFAKSFENDSIKKDDFELITAFEVFEHLNDPISEIENMLSYGNSILFSTEIYRKQFGPISEWWYIIPETGQHVSFFSVKSLQVLADKFNLNLYSNGVNLHLITPKNISPFAFKLFINYKFSFFLINIMKLFKLLPSLTWVDYESQKERLARSK